MLARLACVALVAGCYSPPQPPCGFICGSGGACPSSYTCNPADNRCHLDGASAECDAGGDAGTGSGVYVFPPDGSTEISVAVTIEVDFDFPIVQTDPAAFRVTANGADLPGVTFAAEGDFMADFHPFHQLPGNATILVILEPTIHTVHPFHGVSWSFATGPDHVGPGVSEVMPVGFQDNVSTLGDVRVRFDEAAIGVDATSFILHADTGLVPATVTYDPAKFEAVLRPDAPLPPDSLLDAELTTAITDALGNPILAFTWPFTTAPAVPAPSVVSTVPANGATGVDVGSAITVVFDEDVANVDTTSFAVAAFSGTVMVTGATATFIPDAPLPAATTIPVTLSTAITDLDGNPLAAPVTFSFTTL